MHHSQKRKSGEPYFVHLLNVAYELTKLKAGPKTICAGLLHDCMEDQGVTKEQMIEEFDEEVFVWLKLLQKLVISNLKMKMNIRQLITVKSFLRWLKMSE